VTARRGIFFVRRRSCRQTGLGRWLISI
jgi:hypothetical protein